MTINVNQHPNTDDNHEIPFNQHKNIIMIIVK